MITVGQELLIFRLRRAGCSQSEIAKLAHVAKSTVNHKLRRAKNFAELLALPKYEPRKPKLEITERQAGDPAPLYIWWQRERIKRRWTDSRKMSRKVFSGRVGFVIQVVPETDLNLDPGWR